MEEMSDRLLTIVAVGAGWVCHFPDLKKESIEAATPGGKLAQDRGRSNANSGSPTSEATVWSYTSFHDLPLGLRVVTTEGEGCCVAHRQVRLPVRYFVPLYSRVSWAPDQVDFRTWI